MSPLRRLKLMRRYKFWDNTLPLVELTTIYDMNNIINKEHINMAWPKTPRKHSFTQN